MNMWKLNNTHLNNQRVKVETKKEIIKYFKMSENKDQNTKTYGMLKHSLEGNL